MKTQKIKIETPNQAARKVSTSFNGFKKLGDKKVESVVGHIFRENKMKLKYEITMIVEVDGANATASNAATLNDAAVRAVENVGWYDSVKVVESKIVQKTFPSELKKSLSPCHVCTKNCKDC